MSSASLLDKIRNIRYGLPPHPENQFPLPILRVTLEEFETRKDALETGALYQIWADDVPVEQFYVDPNHSPETVREKVVWILRGAERARAAFLGRANRSPVRHQSVSVVICTRDRPQELARCLASFADQTRRPDELIVVDNASKTNETEQVVRSFGFTYIREDRPGLDYARNAGARAANSDIIVYTDDDVILHKRWLERMTAAFDEPEIEGVTGLVFPAELETQAQWIFETFWGFGRGFHRKDFTPEGYAREKKHGFRPWEVGAGASMAFRRTVFDRIGYFDERLDVGAAGCSGDSEFWNRIVHYGGTCRYEPSAVAFHFHRRDIPGLRRQINAYMSGHTAALLVQLENTKSYGNLRRLVSGLPPYLLRKMASRLVKGAKSKNFTVVDEIIGSIRGVWFYLRAKRPEPGPEPRFLTRTTFSAERLGMKDPLVSVVIPAYNARKTLERTLRSVRAQTYRLLEIVVVDDGSTDGTADIVRAHQAADPRVRLVQQANGGLAAARNAGILAATGEFVAPVDADDLWHPEKIERQLQAMLRSGDACGLSYGDFIVIDEDDRILRYGQRYLPEGDVMTTLMENNFIGNGSSPLVRKHAIMEAGLYDLGLKQRGAEGCEDLKMQLGVAEKYDYAVVPMTLTGYRVSSTSMSAKIGQMICSHRLATEPFKEKYPDLSSLIDNGRFYISLWYVAKALQSGDFRIALREAKILFQQQPYRTAKGLLRYLFEYRPDWWRRMPERRFPADFVGSDARAALSASGVAAGSEHDVSRS